MARRRPLRILLAAAVVTVTAALLASCNRREVAEERSHISGAYRALTFWGESRAYPGNDIPPDKFMRGYEYSKVALRRPLDETFDPHAPAGAAPLAAGQGSGWQPIGPTNGGGRTLTLAFDPTNPDIVYAGAASGGLWRSTTGGVGAAAWQRVQTGFPELGVSTIAFEPGNSDVMYIGTGEVYNHRATGDLEADRRTRGSYGIGILKTTDGGASWSKSLDWSYEQSRGVWAVRVDPFDADVVWAATTEGVYKSVDAGQSWIRKHAVVMAMDLVLHPTIPGLAIVGCGNLSSPGRGIYRTTDGGVFRSLDGGTTFEGVNGGYQSQQFYNGFSSYATDPNLAIGRLQDFGSAIYRGDGQWQRWVLGGDGGWGAIDAGNPDIVYATAHELYLGRSTNGGLSFSVVSPPNLGDPVGSCATT